MRPEVHSQREALTRVFLVLDEEALEVEHVRLAVPPGYDHGVTDVAIRISTGYPPAALDMAYFNPPLQKTSGRAAPNTEGRAAIEGSNWQQWSRHRTDANPWLPGEDNVESHYFYMRAWLADETKR